MSLYQLTLTRALTVYLAQGLICFFFIFLAYKILKRDRKRLNIIFSGFYLSAAIGLFMNFIYAPLDNVDVILFLNYLTNFGIFYSVIFLVVFDLILLKSEKVITPIKQLVILIAFGIAMFCMIFFVYVEGLGVEIDPESWSPHWMLPFFFYLLIIETIPTFLFFYFSFQIYKKFEDVELRKKWKFFIFGAAALIIFMYGIFISNFLNNSTFRLVMGAIGLILAIAGGYLMYTGVGRQLEQ
ncbi:MAG: hypothetical protein HWN81_22950 [Candidatus Lokiarchaeota archaeon]|nr:hypothetical protein [Candidatus Lokiarchaeota archaeon]